jgi:hypothetical protein
VSLRLLYLVFLRLLNLLLLLGRSSASKNIELLVLRGSYAWRDSLGELARPAWLVSLLGASLVDAVHDDGDGLDRRLVQGWHGGARVVPVRDRFVVHASRAVAGFMIFLRAVRGWLCRVVWVGRGLATSGVAASGVS